MKSASVVKLGQALRHRGELTIRLSPIAPGSIPELPRTATWAWVVVYETKDDSVPDALLEGGYADSQTGAIAQANEEFKRQEAKIARIRGTTVRRFVS